MPTDSNDMTISQLSSLADIPISSIKFYIREGLIPKPVKVGGTKAYYNEKHLGRLKLIKKIRTEGGMPLGKIKEVIDIIEDGEKRGAKKNDIPFNDVKSDILSAAINVFRTKGYEKATIADIVTEARIGRSTFYKHFENKKGLFIECFKKIIFSEMKKDELIDITEDIKDEKDLEKVFDKHAKAYYNVNQMWLDMVNQLRAAAINDPDEFADKLDEVIHLKISLLKRGLENGIKGGLFRNINPTIMAVMLIGMQDYHNYVVKNLDEKSQARQYDDTIDIILNGILKR